MIEWIRTSYLSPTVLNPAIFNEKAAPKEVVQQMKADVQKNQTLSQKLQISNVVKFCECCYTEFQQAWSPESMRTGAWMGKKQEIVEACVEKASTH